MSGYVLLEDLREPMPFPLRSFDDLLRMPDPRWLIEGLIPEGLAVLYGAPSTYKSFLALDWALCVATGLSWYGHKVQAGHVIYVAAEGGGGLGKRATAWWEAHDCPEMDRIHFLTRSVDLLDDGQTGRLRDTLADLPEKAVAIVVDTMARSMYGGDENSARDVGRLISAVDELEVGTRLIVHHTGKDGGTERGSGALRGAADVMARVDREGQSPTVQLTCEKSPKDGAPWAPIDLRAEPVAESLVLKAVPRLLASAQAEDERRQRILEFVAEEGPVSQTRVENRIGGKRDRVRETLRQLVDEGRVRMVKHGQANLFVEPRPELGGAVGAGSTGAPGGRPAPQGGGDPEGVLPGGAVGRALAATAPRSPDGTGADPLCGTCGAALAATHRGPICVGCESRATRHTTDEGEAA